MEEQTQKPETITEASPKEQESKAYNMAAAALVIAIIALIVGILALNKEPAATPNTPEAYFASQAKELKVKKKTFEMCIADPATKAKVEADMNEAAALGGTGTPFNIIQDKNGNLFPVSGALPEDVFQGIIDQINTTETLEVPEDFETLDPSLLRNFDPETDYFKGNMNAEIVIYEFSDYECPFCSRVHPTLKNIVEKNANVAWVYRHLPLSFHPQAMPAAIAAECIGQEKGNEAFWAFTDAIYADQNVLK